ncbi:MAG: calcium-binding protein [Pseudomonadota bacterium]
MLFVLGLMGLTALGATMFMDGDDDDMTMLNDNETDEGEPSEEEFTDIGSMIPDDDIPPDPTEDASSEPAQDVALQEDITADIPAEGDAAVQDTDSAVEDTIVQASDPAGEGWTNRLGDESSNQIDGEDGNEFLLGYGGDDEINGNGGMDQIEGGDGDDTLSGGAENDDLHGDFGDDHLMGDDGDDTLSGHFGDDLLEGGDGDDSMIGGQGDDTLDGGAGDDALHGYHGDDVLRGGEGQDSLFGSLGDDVLHGLSETGEDDGVVDYLNGGEGDDLITAGANDIVTAGEGADTIQFGEWNTDAGPAEVLDFEAEQDSLVVLYEPGTEEPEIDVEQDAENSELYRVMADGQLIAQVHSAAPITPSNISLIAQSAA